ncbi:josephin-like protein [Vicia villosa]|uniref:josephin-like protein n=1 Tax=Vicia villosa TaxID=3911 RepID=UPI00273B1520|nr:josephin-like protein [Vicia villosa]XP_058747853.1 josephin-like protein [Vicia villosa]
MSTQNSNVYHERQRLQFCLIHTLNSLFQQKDAFTRADLNAISEKLALDDTSNSDSWTPFSMLFKPHHNALTGNYDINVLIAALEEKGKSVVWHDRRNGCSSIDLDAPEDVLMGVVVNVAVKRFAGIWKGRHWIALRKIDGVWYNLDSDLHGPKCFRDQDEVREFLDSSIVGGGEVLLVMNQKHQA